MKIFSIVVTYNGAKWIDICVGSLIKDGFSEVIVVDNNSEDDTLVELNKKFPEVVVLRMNQNVGFGRANNAGIQYALKHGAEGVFLLNQDAETINGTIQNLAEFSFQHPELGIVSPMHFNGSGYGLDYMFAQHLSRKANAKMMSDFFVQNISKSYEVSYVNAAAWFISKKCLRTVGGFDPMFFMYGEDANYLQRLEYHGLKLTLLPAVQIRHHRSANSDKWNYEQFSDRYFQVLESSIKDDYGNILIDKSLIYLQFKALLKLMLKPGDGRLKEFILLRRWAKEIAKSRRGNKMGASYSFNDHVSYNLS
ncbi:MAG: glycosyltransferase family 2 protein [Marinoscillum sp.]